MFTRSAATSAPGEWTRAEFNRRRLRKLRANWRDCATLVAVGLVALAAAVFGSGIPQLAAVAGFGFVVAICLVTWVVGDIHALPYMWGAVGEQRTAAVLAQLGDGWRSIHDVQRRGGNWDHICVGPSGVFVIESKNTTGRARVRRDILSFGRIEYRGAAFRKSAIELKEELARRGVRPPYVHAVVVIWGEFEQRIHEEQQVAYLAGDELLEWLRSRPVELSGARLSSLRDAVGGFAEARRHAAPVRPAALEPSA